MILSFKRLVLLLLLAVSASANAQTQIQNARVKTRGRMVDGQYIPGKGLPGTVVSIEGITDIGVRNSNGTFSFPVEDNNYYVKSVAKNEYALLDSDAAPKFYNYSEDTLYFVMSMPEQMFEDLLEAKDKIRKTLECEWKNAMAEIKRLKEENRISQEEYLEKLEQLMSNQEKNEDLVNAMAKRYSTLDYDQLDVFYRKVNSYIEEGKLTKADSMLRSRGSVSAQIDAQLRKEETIRQNEEEIRKAKEVLRHDKDELARRCYSYFESFKMQHQYDSAAYYIEQRARLDTINAEWQCNAGYYFLEQKQYSKAELYMTRFFELCCRLSEENPEEYEPDVALSLNNLAVLYSDTQRYSKSEQMYKESLEIYSRLSEDNPEVYEPDVAMSLHNLAGLYIDTQRYSESEQMFKESLEISRRLSEKNPAVYEPDVARVLNGLAGLYLDTQRYSESEQMFKESLEIYRILSEDNPEVYEPDVARLLNDLAVLYQRKSCCSESERLYNESLEICRRLAEENKVYELYVLKLLHNLASLYLDIQRYSESEQMYKESLEIYRRLFEDNPEQYKTVYSTTLGNHSFCCIFMQEFSKAEQYAREGIEVDPTQTFIYSNLASSLLFQGKYNDAEKIYKQYKTELKDSFLSDFEEFEEAGIIPSKYKSDVEKIKQLLNE